MTMPAQRDKRPTIRDVARASGVALSTVSNALLGKVHVSEQTRQKVQAAADLLGYRPSTVARALRARRSFTVGVLVADIANPSYPEIVRGIEDVLLTAACKLFLCNTDGRQDKQFAYMHDFIDRHVDGLILLSQRLDGPEFAALMEQAPPTVSVHRLSARPAIDYVGLDNRGGIAQAMDHLVRLGHQRIAFLVGPAGSSSAAERHEGYCKGLDRAMLRRDPDLVVPGDYTFDGGQGAGAALMHLPAPPTAIVASSDLSAIGVMHSVMQHGLRVPEDVSVVGLDNIYLSAFPQIDLTTIDYPKREVGVAAATLLLRRIQAKEAPMRVQRKIFPMHLIVRGTTAPPRGGAAVADATAAIGV